VIPAVERGGRLFPILPRGERERQRVPSERRQQREKGGQVEGEKKPAVGCVSAGAVPLSMPKKKGGGGANGEDETRDGTSN